MKKIVIGLIIILAIVGAYLEGIHQGITKCNDVIYNSKSHQYTCEVFIPQSISLQDAINSTR